MSESPGALRNGPESPFVVDAIDRLLGGSPAAAADLLAEAADATDWGSVLHRLDVVGRALADEVDGVPADERAADILGGDPAASIVATVQHVVRHWRGGGGISVSIDLTDGAVDARSDQERAWPALVAVAWLVDAAGYPAQVVV